MSADDLIRRVGAAMWKAEAVDAGTPQSVIDARTPEAFADQSAFLQQKWEKLAQHAIAALPAVAPGVQPACGAVLCTWPSCGCTPAALTALSAERDALAAQVAELTRERDEALSAARQQDKLREATLGTLRSVSAALDAAEAKVARLEGALRHEVQRSRRHLAASTLAVLDEIDAALTEGTPE